MKVTAATHTQKAIRAEIGHRFRQEIRRIGGGTFVAAALGRSRNTINHWYVTAAFDVVDLLSLESHGLCIEYVVRGTRTSDRPEQVADMPNQPAYPSVEGAVLDQAATHLEAAACLLRSRLLQPATTAGRNSPAFPAGAL